MEIKYNFSKDNSHINNLAFIRALFIRDTIESLDVSIEENNVAVFQEKTLIDQIFKKCYL